MAKLLCLLLDFALLFYICEPYKILVVFPLPGKSHGILGSGIVNHLLNHGHKVTYITPFVKENPHQNLTQVDVSANAELMPIDQVMDLKTHLGSNKIQFKTDSITKISGIVSATLENENVQKLLLDPNEKFDLVNIDWMLTEILASIAAVYDAPFIWVSTVEPHWMVTRLIDERLNPAYNCNTMSKSTPPLNFLQKVNELWSQIVISVFLYIYQDVTIKNNYERIIAPIIKRQGREPPVFDDIKFNASLVLGNSHVSLGQATRLPQNYKPVAGYHIDEIVKPLPKDLQKIMDDAKYGVIYFSMGSNIKSSSMPEEMKKNLLKVFEGVKQTVLWKLEDKSIDLPKNVHILTWAPQQSILAHPNCILFISHGGLLSTTEAVHFAVPIIGIPVFGDQYINVERAVHKGFAEKVTLSLTMHDELKDAIGKIIGNPRYAKKVKELSFIYHHRPARPAAELVHWVEHVIHTGGAPHLKSLALRVAWYQKLYLDLAIAVTVMLTGIVVLLKRLIRTFIFKPKVDGYKKKN